MPPQYLRISVTSQCNLNCFYCRPSSARARPDTAQELSVRDIATVVECSAAEGVRKVRITGGEPLLRDDLEGIVHAVSATPGIRETTLTTNGIGLDRRARALRRAGLGRVNVSLDTLRPERFLAITGKDRHRDVLAGVEAAAGVFPVVKLNTVLLRGVNDDEIEALVALAARRGLWIRFIERYSSTETRAAENTRVTAREVEARLRRAFGRLQPLPREDLSVEQAYELPLMAGVRVGLIASVTHPPCWACTKLRLTAAGSLRACLFGQAGADLLPLLRRGDTAAVRAAIRQVFALKGASRERRSPIVPLPISEVGG